MKRILSILLVMAMLLAALASFAGCDSKKKRNDDDDDDDDEKSKIVESSVDESNNSDASDISDNSKGESSSEESSLPETSKEENSQEESSEPEINTPAPAYTKGAIYGDYYINDWANLKFKITDEWPKASEAAYSSYENDVTDCGFVAQDANQTHQLAIIFEDLTGTGVTTEEQYASIFANSIISVYTEMGFSAVAADGDRDDIAGEEYYGVPIQLTVGDRVLYQALFARIVDERIIAILVTHSDLNEIIEVIETIQPAI